MPRFEINMQHSEESFTALAHMQYNLFCGRNRLARTVISALLICFGAANMDAWWGLLIIAYAGYLLTSRYSSANRTARKLAESIKAANMDFPRSRYIFEEKAMRVLSLPEEEELTPLAYSEVRGLGEDLTYFYIFRSEQGATWFPKMPWGTGIRSSGILWKKRQAGALCPAAHPSGAFRPGFAAGKTARSIFERCIKKTDNPLPRISRQGVVLMHPGGGRQWGRAEKRYFPA